MKTEKHRQVYLNRTIQHILGLVWLKTTTTKKHIIDDNVQVVTLVQRKPSMASGTVSCL